MEARGALSYFYPILKEVLLDGDGAIPAVIKQGLMVALSSRCSNNYCFVVHGRNLLMMGMSMEHVEAVVRSLEFPPEIKNHEKWSQVLKWAYFFGNSLSSNASDETENDDVILSLIGDEEYQEIFKVCSANNILNLFTIFFAEEIRTANESGFKKEDGNLGMEIPALVKFYQGLSQDDSKSARPVVSMCMHCKNIRGNDGKWRALETTLMALDRRSLFSHGICQNCSIKNSHS
jgi:hypothetical protein